MAIDVFIKLNEFQFSLISMLKKILFQHSNLMLQFLKPL